MGERQLSGVIFPARSQPYQIHRVQEKDGEIFVEDRDVSSVNKFTVPLAARIQGSPSSNTLGLHEPTIRFFAQHATPTHMQRGSVTVNR